MNEIPIIDGLHLAFAYGGALIGCLCGWLIARQSKNGGAR